MASDKQETTESYNRLAQKWSNYAHKSGPRIYDINKAFELAGNPVQAVVVELGCGDGRDAAYIATLTPYYHGFDLSEGLVSIAQKDLPDVDITVGDVATYEFPDQVDIVFAFASLLHVPKDEVTQILGRAHRALKPGGIFFLSLKLWHEYSSERKEDAMGARTFYYYNPELIRAMAGPGYSVVHTKTGFKSRGTDDWFEIALKKVVQ